MIRSFTLILFFSGIFSAVAQIPFPASNTVWTQRQGTGESAPQFNVIGLLNDDITVGSISYHKLYFSTNDAVLEPSEYCGGLREDASGKVYFYNASSGTEKLLYDFSLAVGDTIFDPATANPDGVVYLVDSVTIGGLPHKRLQFRQLSSGALWTGGAWVEGIGNSGLGGLLGSAMRQPTCDCATNTICMSVATTSTYHNPQYLTIDCENVVSVANFPQVVKPLTVVPNPVKGVSRIVIGANNPYTSYTITDLVGRIIAAREVSFLSGEILINKADLLPGIYVYSLRGSGAETATGKFIVE